ncbi:MAG: acyltransferase [Blautia sp.]|nr:acyltransferase [Blautia sp.]
MTLMIYPILLLIVTFYGAEWKRPDLYVQSRMIRAAACMGILLHHLTQKVTGYGTIDKGPVTVFNYLGILFTALFFFFSGYGLVTSVYTKPDYLKTFLIRRLPSILIPFWVINLLEILLNRFVYGTKDSLSEILKDLFGITLINSNGWFIVEIVILYLLFFLSFSLIRKKDAALLLMCVFTLLLIHYGFHKGHDPVGNQAHWFRGEWWYNSTVTFAFGMLAARLKKASRFLDRHYHAVVAAACVLFSAALYASIYTVRHLGYYSETMSFGRHKAAVTFASQMAVCIVFTFLVLLASMRISIGNQALRSMSGISLEFLLIHGYLVNRVFDRMKMNDTARFALVAAASMICSAAVAVVTRWLVKKSISLLASIDITARKPIFEKSRAKRKKAILAAAAFVAGFAVMTLIRLGMPYVFAGKEYAEECEAIRSAGIGDVVLWGRFETNPSRLGKERLSWILIRRDGDKVCLLSKEGVAGSYYHQKHEAVSWEKCDLRAFINSDTFTDMFSRYEKNSIMPRDGDLITLLTVTEAQEAFFTEKERELEITAAARAKGTNINRMSKANNWDMKGYRSSWWWLKEENDRESIFAPIVTEDGKIVTDKKPVNKPNGAVRLVIWVNSTADMGV